MSGAAATNANVSIGESVRLPLLSGGAINPNIPVASLEQWRKEAIQKIVRFQNLAHNWDGRGSSEPSKAVRQTALEFVRTAPANSRPRIVPVSGGGVQLDWSTRSKELEFFVSPTCEIIPLKVLDGMPIEEECQLDVRALFSWLTS